MPYIQAKGLGAKVVDETVSRTFVIKQSKSKHKPQPEFASTWGTIGYKYRPPKKQKVGHYIERTSYAIDSLGEHEGITVKGWIAKRNKARRKGFII